MLLSRAGRLSPRLCSSYIEISNYVRSRQTALRSGVYGSVIPRKAFHARSHLLEEAPTRLEPRQFLEQYKASVEFPSATYDFETFLSQAAPDQEVVLHGYLGDRKDLSKKLAFVRLTDPTMRHSIQLVSLAKSGSLEKLKSVRPNSPVAVRGKVQQKQSKGSEMEKTDPWELQLEEVYPLNEFPKDILMKSDTVFAPKHRYLQLRADAELREALRFRAQVHNICKEELEQCRPPFVEIETPLLFKSTPEGAREFLVPTRKQGLAYALPQSPQQYKQILMASGIPRYYQFARCFRDEDLRADRQPEFTQLDLEMSFATGDDVMRTIEGVIRRLWSSLMKDPAPEGPFRKVSYEEVMGRYGSDKPDTRYGMEISRIGHLLPVDLVNKITPLLDPIVEVFKVENNENDPAAMAQFIKEFLDSPAGAPFNDNPEGGPGVFVYDAKKPLCGLQPFGFEAAEYMEELLDLDHGDLIIIQAREQAPFSGGSTPIGDLRRALHSAAVTSGFKPAPTGFDFLWVVDFPLFSPSSDSEPGQGGAAGISSTHHPFTAPKNAADVDLLLSDPTKVVADHYDLVVNGVELGGGSRRIHDAAVQEFILRDILQMPAERLADFAHLLEALRAGCPPHAGLALGFDRLVAVMLGKESVRDVIAFPKMGKGGEDPMVKAPSPMTEEALNTYHLRMKE
ncbi:putative aspartyl-tRNA synthetase [Aspergillus steynii IBT 23096]|uniref:Putative aspartyl-tRNA synthetase n=1 Tax=Aspergillus steynii IBT 23096 TaxID=1392250 RepID=A0A2I2GNY7_9EURO|nr:putative aspartyl-tRNA synthetase [Aspergillus steynii IBT 23096]PLB54591.1 putative aspartyl-tRNA synthetase [Aspergillus steynii IBT 23096]